MGDSGDQKKIGQRKNLVMTKIQKIKKFEKMFL
jgi:hypothetical protein